jgi:hypothetical protein
MLIVRSNGQSATFRELKLCDYLGFDSELADQLAVSRFQALTDALSAPAIHFPSGETARAEASVGIFGRNVKDRRQP